MAVEITKLYQCRISFDCHPDADDWASGWPDWDLLIDLAWKAATEAKRSDHDSVIAEFSGGVACFPYLEITAPTRGEVQAMADAVIRCVTANGGRVIP